jgi:tRNA acetyltransferase TAN1
LISGDVGVFVTCDKGKEKACLREAEDLLAEELGLHDGVDGDEGAAALEETPNGQRLDGDEAGSASAAATKPQSNSNGSIEDEIQRELAALSQNAPSGTKRKRNDSDPPNDAAAQRNKLALVTLDIPCVSFVRFPTGLTRGPADVITKICADAQKNPGRQRSRFIKRLTPLSRVRKVMSGGIEELCEEVLPQVFGPGWGPDDIEGEGGTEGEGAKGWRFAVRVTVRNNGAVKRDEVIKTVASKISQLGREREEESRHRVDLKGYQRLVLVEIYRNVVGMSVVDERYEELRRFNLAEIYADARRDLEGKEGDAKDEGGASEVHGDGATVDATAQ